MPTDRSNVSFFVSAIVWNLGLGMTWLVVPLYGTAQGLSNSEVGALVALPIVLQAFINLAGGSYADLFGGRRIMLGSCWVMALASLWFLYAQGFWMLLAGQAGLIVARASYWPATWAMATELPGERGVQLGRLNALTNIGQIVGTVVCGFLLAHAGFKAAFLTIAAVSVAAYFVGLGTRSHRPAAHAAQALRFTRLFAAYGPLLRNPLVQYSVLCAYLSALPFSLSVSFYPLLLVHFGYGEDASGVLLALRAVGAIAAGLIAGRFVRTGPETLWPVICGAGVAAAVGLMPLVNHALPLGFWLLVVGLGSGAMTLYFQITISEASEPSVRGTALALGGLGWSVSHLSTPLLMGWLADSVGIVPAFYVLGIVSLGCTAAIALARRWAFSHGRLAAPAPR